MPRIMRALISVSDKTDVVWLAGELTSMGIEIISTGGTYKVISQNDIKVVPVAEVTGFPEMLDGRVKTLHPKVHGGILADRSKPEHMRQLDYQKIPAIDLVVVNLYPFAQTAARPGVTRQEAIEQIDIGGPTMVRAAAKNHAHIAVVVNPARYRALVNEMKRSGGQVTDETCRELAREAFAHTAEYDAMIFDYLSGEAGDKPTPSASPEGEGGMFPESLTLEFREVASLRYGENPHQSAAVYAEEGYEGDSLATARQVAGPSLSFNNLLDGEAAWWGVLEFEEPAVVIIKHNNPCGVAVAGSPVVAYTRALDCDPVSAFGSVVAFNRPLDAETARALTDNFIELLLAPHFETEALEVLAAKKEFRILEMGDITSGVDPGMDYRRIHGGLLLQQYDREPDSRDRMQVATKVAPTDDQWEDLLFAWRVCKHVKSNAIVFVRGRATVGIGAGQMSRVDSVMIASEKSGGKSRGSVMASDAFFPFTDGIEKAAAAGITAVIQPGGSVKDDEVVAACDRHGMAMVFTGRRHFRH
ncbi:MAG: bifunctional phosphoribosylaminoimidazolecarboxamide formyltransferase/IMP cyclohydrolase [Actinobacteria bacterium]|nr:bifunctional phosphoribosylaminoimidazolecarboxamide formyltransferase/IMP cyclohydrolase [Actinomycetota bacterium]